MSKLRIKPASNGFAGDIFFLAGDEGLAALVTGYEQARLMAAAEQMYEALRKLEFLDGLCVACGTPDRAHIADCIIGQALQATVPPDEYCTCSDPRYNDDPADWLDPWCPVHGSK